MKHFILMLAGVAVATIQLQAQKRQQWINEVIATEKAFCEDLKAKGVAYAFEAYAAQDAVIKRGNDSLIYGKAAIRNFYAAPGYQNAIADWKPDFTDVSADGTMAYTYGKYTWTFKDKAGKETQYSGVFHTVWKRQADGSWKYVWD
jgi:ketosteroid isomerase-like protein